MSVSIHKNHTKFFHPLSSRENFVEKKKISEKITSKIDTRQCFHIHQAVFIYFDELTIFSWINTIFISIYDVNMWEREWRPLSALMIEICQRNHVFNLRHRALNFHRRRDRELQFKQPIFYFNLHTHSNLRRKRSSANLFIDSSHSLEREDSESYFFWSTAGVNMSHNNTFLTRA